MDHVRPEPYNMERGRLAQRSGPKPRPPYPEKHVAIHSSNEAPTTIAVKFQY
ncbi:MULTISPECIES: hypothetical protein [unclassified Lentimonas]|uniref:hypothetical protein n=1 Tax=unclassified Lentimonas TaxID=2630993 RepID=UPI001327AB25|nr:MULTISPECIES: hypothetical protein [unclassified Lentimonas]CAA6676494.1 Unannotated [Lentimonas sp. CC4]CAA6685334.1 Unannotated [Lentimonas sp. CC6]CAA7074942.1 Unannotated [Lentimonas sp. CC4]CAA7169568.1 Unannotated [Lentimonas sp. CC21]CAA7182671.1 Unannotated [Lentimonas sp. CC8]